MADVELISQLRKVVEAYDKAKREGRDANAELTQGLRGITEGTRDVASGLDSMGNALSGFSKLSIDGKNSFEGLSVSLKQGISSLKSFTEVAESVPLLSTLMAPLVGTLKVAMDTMSNVIDITKNMAEAYDGIDQGTRELTKNQYGYAAGLGLTFDQAVKNTSAFQGLIKANSELSASGIYFDSDDFKRGVDVLQSAGIAMEDLTRASGVASGGLNNMQAMSLQAKAMGMDIGEYSRKIADMVRKNGISIEESMSLMASSQSIAGETGLKVDEVTQSLESATSGFQKMGATMDFGRPVLKGFADSVREVGLGIGQAGDLAADFSKSLLGIVNNPALAYMTAMKGGFGGGMGGPGGILNPSIQMQALMLDQKPGAQAELASNLSMGMREMLKSQTGGEIITVKEAAAGDAATQSRFYTQQQMLGSMYGISDTTTQSRVLEYLEQLETATAEGNKEQVDKINQQIADATNANDKTFDIQQKIAQSLDKSLILAQEQLNVQKASFIDKGGESAILSKIDAMTNISEKMLGAKGSELEGLKSDYDKAKADLFKLENIKDKIDSARSGNAAEVPPASAGTGNAPRESGLGSSSVGTTAAIQQEVNVKLIVEDRTKDGASVTPGGTSAGPGQVGPKR